MNQHAQHGAPGFVVCGSEPPAQHPDLVLESLRPMLCVWVMDLALAYVRADRVVDMVEDPRGDRRVRALFGEGISACVEALLEHSNEDEEDEQEIFSIGARRRRRKSGKAQVLRQHFHGMREAAVQQGVSFASPIWHNLGTLTRLLNLTAAEQFVLLFATCMGGITHFNRVVSALSIEMDTTNLALALSGLSGLPTVEVADALSAKGSLRATGLITMPESACDLESKVCIREDLPDLMLGQTVCEEDLLARFVDRLPPATLSIAQFPHLVDDTEIVTGLIKQARATGRAGTNILLYGPPGVGKTEYAVALSHALSLSAFEVKYADQDGDPIGGMGRLRAYNLGQRLLSRNRDAVLIFDEVEDVFENNPLASLFAGARVESRGKAWINRSLENNAIPAIWITNELDGIDPAYLRRFDYTVKFAVPPFSVRKHIVAHHLSAWLDASDDTLLSAIAARDHTTPAQLQNAAQVAQSLVGQPSDPAGAEYGRNLILRALDRSAALLGQPKPSWASGRTTAFDLAYVNADVDVSHLVAALARRPCGRFCFYGAPGTGKSEFGRYLAEVIDRPVIVKRGSDLLSKWLGDTESRIADMFEQASQQGAVLILDEADSFLRSREHAEHSWEVSQVNELLTQMEAFEGIFICTTNLAEHLDPASLRRFDWKVRFSPLTSHQRWALFAQEFIRLGGTFDAAQGVEHGVFRLEGLTAGDIATVVRQYRLLDVTPTANELIARLDSEISLRERGRAANPRSTEKPHAHDQTRQEARNEYA
ncbi:AAA family ATPase [Niveibacterium sp. 24ML]|uniref:AAA family ATPase n=1 Tax=Niveibacterium sp. 24ML TaxID=2985512 RepID=UPI00226EA309|nr:AAA family ATPase [Niveibacterium sp. 24ML]MCX9157808.1 AAA family ATPase [Niveibacterium sp. 24ML]